MEESKGKGMKIVIYILSILVVVGLFITGFIWYFGQDENTESDEPTNDLEFVEVIEDEEKKDDDLDAEEIDEATTEVTAPTTDESDEDTQPVDESETPNAETDTETPAGAKTVGTATAAEAANVVGYAYEVASGKFIFEWKVNSTGGLYPKTVASVVENTQIKVVFESLQKDYVAVEETTTQLGSQLPELVWKPTATGSEYLFKYTAEKNFELKTVDRGTEGRFVVLEVGL